VGAVLFGVLAGVLFGAFAVVIRRGLQRGGDPGVGALVVTGIGVLTATLLAGRSIATGGVHPGSLWPFLLIGAMVPGVLGTVLVVAGGAVLVRERARPEHFRALGRPGTRLRRALRRPRQRRPLGCSRRPPSAARRLDRRAARLLHRRSRLAQRANRAASRLGRRPRRRRRRDHRRRALSSATRAATASPTSRVVDSPPTSRVRGPSRQTSSSAAISVRAASRSPR
jgi:hypothetical protein